MLSAPTDPSWEAFTTWADLAARLMDLPPARVATEIRCGECRRLGMQPLKLGLLVFSAERVPFVVTVRRKRQPSRRPHYYGIPGVAWIRFEGREVQGMTTCLARGPAALACHRRHHPLRPLTLGELDRLWKKTPKGEALYLEAGIAGVPAAQASRASEGLAMYIFSNKPLGGA